MTRLILTTEDSGAGSLRAARIADIVLPSAFGSSGDRCRPTQSSQRSWRRAPRNTALRAPTGWILSARGIL